MVIFFFFFKQKTAYEMVRSDWSSDVCSSDLGLRVRLKGGPGNPTGVGAQMRLIYGERKGPVREIHAGSGYWSQDGAVQVLGTPKTPTQLWVRWAGGRTTTNPVPAGAREVEVEVQGRMRVLRQ